MVSIKQASWRTDSVPGSVPGVSSAKNKIVRTQGADGLANREKSRTAATAMRETQPCDGGGLSVQVGVYGGSKSMDPAPSCLGSNISPSL